MTEWLLYRKKTENSFIENLHLQANNLK
jgi:hypothetical protein